MEIRHQEKNLWFFELILEDFAFHSYSYLLKTK